MEEYRALFFGPFRLITVKKEINFTVSNENPNIKDLIDEIIAQFPKIHDLYYEAGLFSQSVNCIINGEDIRTHNNLETLLSTTDRITFFKAAGGG